MYSTNRALLIYDGNCGVCSSWATWITKKWKEPHTAEAVPCQWLSEADLQSLGLSTDDVKRAAWWVEDGQRSRGHAAVARSLVLVGSVWGLVGRLLLVPPVSWPAAVGYSVVSRYRYLFPGGTPACKN